MSIAQLRVFVFFPIICCGLMCFQLSGQATSGSVVGTVTDSSGASVANTKLTLFNLSTADQQTLQTGDSGTYVFVNLVPGMYRLTAEHEGFQRMVRQPIEVNVQAQIRVDVALQVGATTQTVEVGAAAPLLETENASLSTEIDSKQVADLALNGRNVMNLIELVPGVMQGTGAIGNPIGNTNGGSMTTVTAWMNYQIGGGQLNQSAAFLDGAPINNPQDNTSILVPVQDSVQEFRVVTNNVSAEFGHFAGGAVSLVTKSGTNTFHGGAYEFLRNKAVNANYFYNNIIGLPVPEFTQNQYGAYVGGPVKKDKLFVFFSWENYIFREQTPSLFNVPTAAMRAGDFSQKGLPTIYDPLTICGFYGNAACPVVNGNPVYTRQAFPNNIIPPGRILPQALLIEKDWALPNAVGAGSTSAPVNNFITNQFYGGPQHQYVPRLDYNLSDKQRIFGRYTFWNGGVTPGNPYTGNGAVQDQVGMSTNWKSQNAVVGDNYILSPTTILSTRLAYSRFDYANVAADYLGVGSVGCTPEICPSGAEQLRRLGPAYVALIPQMAQALPVGTSIQNFSLTPGGTSDTYSKNSLYTVSGDLTKIVGRHSLKFGGETRLARWDQWIARGAGTLTYTNLWTSQNPLSSAGSGYGFASFLLGIPTSGVDTIARPIGMYNHYSGLYITDTFQVSSKLTLTAGLRWDLPGSWASRYGIGAVFAPGASNPLAQSIGLPLQGAVAPFNSSLHPNSTLFPMHYKLFAPRLGLAYRVKEGTVVRAGYAIAYTPLDTPLTSAAPSNGPAATGTSTFVASLNGNLTPSTGNLANPWPNGLVQPAGTNAAALIANTEGQTLTIPFGDIRYPYVQQWNVNIGHEYGHGMMTEVGYAGLKGTHLPMSSLGYDMNQLPDQYDSLGQALLKSVPNPFQNAVLPGGTLAGPTILAGQLLRPYSQYQNVGIPSYYVGNSTYNSLQVKVQKRFSEGGTINVAYTWSKLLSDTDSIAANTCQDYFNLGGCKSLSSDNAAQRLVISYTLDLPFGRGKALFKGAPSVVNAVISGWGVNGVTTVQSGLPLSLTYGGTNQLGANFGTGPIRPNVIPGCQKDPGGTAEQKLGSGVWYNVACFTAPDTVFSFGNEPRVDPTLRQQGITNFDVAVRRTIRIRERYGLELRIESFNLTNHPRFNPPGTVIGTSSAGQIQAAVSSQGNTPRTFQFAARMTF
jgi:hypothetical protein